MKVHLTVTLLIKMLINPQIMVCSKLIAIIGARAILNPNMTNAVLLAQVYLTVREMPTVPTEFGKNKGTMDGMAIKIINLLATTTKLTVDYQ
jgi:hypothetical protein